MIERLWYFHSTLLFDASADRPIFFIRPVYCWMLVRPVNKVINYLLDYYI